MIFEVAGTQALDIMAVTFFTFRGKEKIAAVFGKNPGVIASCPPDAGQVLSTRGKGARRLRLCGRGCEREQGRKYKKTQDGPFIQGTALNRMTHARINASMRQ